MASLTPIWIPEAAPFRLQVFSGSVPRCTRNERDNFSCSTAICSNSIQKTSCALVALATVCRRKSRRKNRIITFGAPRDYYSLFGLPLFTSDLKEIKAAHRRVIKLVHPDICGAESAELVNLVTEVYGLLSDDDLRKAYDDKLRRLKPTLSTSKWSEEAPEYVKGVFVDETQCEECCRCVSIASSTFAIHESAVRQGKAHVKLQYGDDRNIVKEAVNACPSDAIRYVSREDLPKLEYAMQKCARLRQRARPEDLDSLPGPYDIYEELMLDELIGMDMEKALQSDADPLSDTKVAEDLAIQAKELAQAASVLPPETQDRLWPESFSQDAASKQALEEEHVGFRRRAQAVSEQNAAGVQRAELKAMVFYTLDKDGDDFLYDGELRAFATKFGFEGSNAEWIEEYQGMCAELNCSPAQGLDMQAFSRMVDDPEGCPLNDAELASLLSESGQLPRAGSRTA